MKFEPVRWLTATVAILTALLGTTALTDVLPKQAVGWLGLAIAVLTAVLGAMARGAVTPLAQPEDAEGRQLVPRS
ncbi:MAG TPA: hypothetical protein VIP77_16120 [Jiangellaceae bacterium]